MQDSPARTEIQPLQRDRPWWEERQEALVLLGRSSRSFGWQCLLTLLFLGIGVFPIGSLLLLNRYDNLEIKWAHGLYREKDIAAIRAEKRGSSRLFVVGGSNALFGVDAELMEAKLGIPTVNYANHAGLGMEYMLQRVRQILHPGEAVVLALEYRLLMDPLPMRQMHWDYVISYDKAGAVSLGWRAITAIYGTPFRDYIQSVKSLWNALTLIEEPIGSYGLTRMSANGDIRVITEHNEKIYPPGPFSSTDPSKVACLRKFVSWASTHDIKVFATWPNSFLGEGKDAVSAAQQMHFMEEMFRGMGITVLGTISDCTFPKSLFMDTSYHLGPAGRRLRTERLIKQLRPFFGRTAVHPEEQGMFLMPLVTTEVTEGNLFDNLPNMQFRCLSKQPADYPDLTTLDDSIRMQERGVPVYYDDADIDSQFLQAGYWGEEVSRGQTSLAYLISQYNNHVFLLVAIGTNRFEQASTEGLPGSFAEFLAGDGYRVGILGTGQYAKVKRVYKDGNATTLSLRINDLLGDRLRSPVQISLKSAAESSHLKVDERELSAQTGLAVAVLDVEPGIVLKSCTLPGAAPDVSWRMNRLARLDRVQGVVVEEVDPTRFVASGNPAPRVTIAGGAAQLEFTGSQGFWALRLEENLKHRVGVLELTCRVERPGRIVGTVTTNSPGRFSYIPPVLPLGNGEKIQQIRIRFEIKSFLRRNGGEWALVGLEGHSPGGKVIVKRARILWKD